VSAHTHALEKDDYTELLTNPGFESVGVGDGTPSQENNQTVNGVNDWFRFCPYGWNHTIVYDGNEIVWDSDNNSADTNITAGGANLKNSYGVNTDAYAVTKEGAYLCWAKPDKPLDLMELYQEIPVGNDAGQLPPGTYVISCRLGIAGAANTDRRFTTQRLCAQTATQNKVQYYGRETDYELNLTSGETATYADWISNSTSGTNEAFLHPLSVTITVNAGETLRVGVKTSNKSKDGSPATGTDVGWFKVDDFRIWKKNSDDYTDQIVNSSFELKDAGTPIGNGYVDSGSSIANKYAYVERHLHYGWTQDMFKYDAESNPLVFIWDAEHNSSTSNITPGAANFGSSVGCNPGSQSVVGRGYYSFWISPSTLWQYALYQDITGLPAGKYRVSCLMSNTSTQHSSQRLFANNSVQFLGIADDYGLDNQLTKEEKALNDASQLTVTYAGYIVTDLTGDFQPLSVDVVITAGETLRIGFRTNRIIKSGSTGAGTRGNTRIDEFRLKQLEDYTGSTALTPATADKVEKSAQYYTLTGIEAPATAKGLLLKKITYTDGSVMVEKVMNR
jgi:hypothetical protein